MPCNHKFQGHKNGVTCLLCGLTMSPEEYGVYLLAQAAPKAGVTATEAAEQLSQPMTEVAERVTACIPKKRTRKKKEATADE